MCKESFSHSKVKPTYLHDNVCVPIFSRQSTRCTTKEIVNALLDPNDEQSLNCCTIPTCVEINSVFVIDTVSLRSIKDIYCDDMGSWKSNGTYSCVVEVSADGDATTVVLYDEESLSKTMYKMKKRYFKHGTSKDLKKIVVLMQGMCVN